MEKEMNVKQEIMEQDLDKVAGGKVDVGKAIKTAVKVATTVAKNLPGQNNGNGAGAGNAGSTAPGNGGEPIFNQELQNNTKLVNNVNVHGKNKLGDVDLS